MNLRPIQDRVIIKQREADAVSEGGIHLAGEAEKPLKGDVISVGPGRWFESVFIEPAVKEGDVVIFGKSAGEEVEIDDDTTLLVLRETEILAILDE